MADQELLDVVDEKNNVIGQDTKENKFRKGLITRNVAILILDENKKLLITKRSPHKKTFPNRYDLAACGNVKSGETYEEAAKREVKEELGIEIDLKLLDTTYNKFKHENMILKYFTGVFLGYFSGEVNLNEELVEIDKFSIKEVEEKIKENKNQFTPGFVHDFLYVKDKLK